MNSPLSPEAAPASSSLARHLGEVWLSHGVVFEQAVSRGNVPWIVPSITTDDGLVYGLIRGRVAQVTEGARGLGECEVEVGDFEDRRWS